jgi:hypothetical protein
MFAHHKKIWIRFRYLVLSFIIILYVNLSCEIGKELGVNLVFLGSVVAASEYEYNLVFYLLDVTSGKIYKRSEKIHGARLNSEIKLFAKQYFSSYSTPD